MTTSDDKNGVAITPNFQQAAAATSNSLSLIKRAASHGLIKVIYFGDRPHLAAGELERILREGLPKIPPGYKRRTSGPVIGGRPPGKAKATTPPKRTRRRGSESRPAGAP
jgi:hypothetical protein